MSDRSNVFTHACAWCGYGIKPPIFASGKLPGFYHEKCWKEALAAKASGKSIRPYKTMDRKESDMSKLKLMNYTIDAIKAGEDGHTVNVVFEVGDLSECAALINGCKSLGARGTVTQETTAPKKDKKKKDPEPEEPETDEDEEEEDEDEDDDEEDEEEKPAKKSAGKKKPAADEDDEDEDEEEEEEEDEDDEEDEDEDEDEKPAKKKKKDEPEEPATPGKFKITKEMKNAKKLREVVEELIKQGVKSKKKLTKMCIQLKDKIPCLERITDLEDRVPKCAEYVSPDVTD